MPPKPKMIVPREAPTPAEPLPLRVPTAKDFLDRLQRSITDLLDDKETAAGDKLKAITAGINLAKVRAGIDEEDDDEGMGFAQR